MTQPRLDDEEVRIVESRHHDPFAVLGRHPTNDGVVVCAYIPHAMEVTIAEGDLHMERVAETDFFKWRGPAAAVPARYRLIWRDDAHHRAYRLRSLLLSAADLGLRSASVRRRQALACLPVPRRHTPTRWTACAACCSPCGRPMPSASAWSAISTAGTAAVIRCGCAAAAACGNCSSPTSVPGRSTSSRSATVTPARSCSNPIPTASSSSCGPARPSIVVAEPHLRLEDADVAGTARGLGLAACPDVGLRGPSRFLAARTGGGVPELSGAGPDGWSIT